MQTRFSVSRPRGTQLSVAADAKMMGDPVKQGSTVKASYNEKDGKKVVTQIEVKN